MMLLVPDAMVIWEACRSTLSPPLDSVLMTMRPPMLMILLDVFTKGVPPVPGITMMLLFPLFRMLVPITTLPTLVSYSWLPSWTSKLRPKLL